MFPFVLMNTTFLTVQIIPFLFFFKEEGWKLASHYVRRVIDVSLFSQTKVQAALSFIYRSCFLDSSQH